MEGEEKVKVVEDCVKLVEVIDGETRDGKGRDDCSEVVEVINGETRDEGSQGCLW